MSRASSEAQGGISPMLRPGDGVYVGPSMMTRREFAAAAAATAAAALAGSARGARADEGGAEDQSQAQAGDAADGADDQGGATSEGDGATNILYEFEDVSADLPFEPIMTFDLPLGSLVSCDSDSYAAVLQANDSARPLTVIGCLDYTNGTYSTILDAPVTGEDYAPSECRIANGVIAWVETNNATDDWVLYAAPFDGGPITGSGYVTRLGEGDADWLPPQFAVWNTTVVWQVMPDPNGPHVTESSHAYRWQVGASAATTVYTSPGRFACAPTINEGVLTIAPRVNADEGVYYGITAIDLVNNETQLDQLVLPVSIKPFMAVYIGGALAFSIEANYGYGGMFGNMGYYIGPSTGPFLSLPLEPSAQVGYVGGYYVMKNQLVYLLVDAQRRRYGRITSAGGCASYGDYPATTGTSQVFMTYAAIKDQSTGIPNRVLVRVFSLS